MSTIRINPPVDIVELAAALEVTKTLALNALMLVKFVLDSSGGANASVGAAQIIQSMKGLIVSRINEAEIALPDADIARYRAYAEATLEELVGRVTIQGAPVNPLSS